MITVLSFYKLKKIKKLKSLKNILLKKLTIYLLKV